MLWARTGRCGVRAIRAILRTPCFCIFRWRFGFGAGRQRCRNVAELIQKIILERLGFALLLPQLRRQGALRLRSRLSDFALRLPNSFQLELYLCGAVLLLLQPLVSNLCLQLQL